MRFCAFFGAIFDFMVRQSSETLSAEFNPEDI